MQLNEARPCLLAASGLGIALVTVVACSPNSSESTKPVASAQDQHDEPHDVHLVQYHFHAPSEHTIEGGQLPLEVHFVREPQSGDLAVVGVLVEDSQD